MIRIIPPSATKIVGENTPAEGSSAVDVGVGVVVGETVPVGV
jgi:hypothetical protein